MQIGTFFFTFVYNFCSAALPIPPETFVCCGHLLGDATTCQKAEDLPSCWMYVSACGTNMKTHCGKNAQNCPSHSGWSAACAALAVRSKAARSAAGGRHDGRLAANTASLGRRATDTRVLDPESGRDIDCTLSRPHGQGGEAEVLWALFPKPHRVHHSLGKVLLRHTWTIA